MYEHFFALCPGGSEGGKYSTVEVSGADAYHTGYTDPLYYLFYMPSPLLYPTLPYSTLPYPTLLYSTLLYSTYVHTVHTTTKREKEKKKRNVLGRLHTYIHTYSTQQQPPPPLLLLPGQPMIMIYVEHIPYWYCIVL